MGAIDLPSQLPLLPSVDCVSLSAQLPVAALWGQVMSAVQGHALQHRVDLRDVLVLLPQAALLPQAQAAWQRHAGAQGWSPRFETTQTLGERIAAAPAPEPGALRFDAASDRLQAAAFLRQARPDWARSDPQGHAVAVARVIASAQALARARLAQAPAGRAAWLAKARGLLAPAETPDALERSLARLALEWSLQAHAPGDAALWPHVTSVGALVIVDAGTGDPLPQALAEHAEAAGVPALRIDAALDLAQAAHAPARVEGAVARDAEDEAQCCAAVLLREIEAGTAPIALIAQDRGLVRRVRALLERSGVALRDETGWRLSTTRAGASVAGWLRAALAPQAGADAWLEALKSAPVPWPGIDEIESLMRRRGASRLAAIDGDALVGDAAQAWTRWQALQAAFPTSGRRSAAAWLAALQGLLEQAGQGEALQADAAGAQVYAALRLGGEWAGAREALSAVELSAGEFAAWVDDVLEHAEFRPAAQQAATVIVTPLARAGLRDFALIVCPGADAVRLGAAPAPDALLGDATAAALGVPDSAARRRAETASFAQMLRCERVVLLRREADGEEQLPASPLWRRLERAHAGGLPGVVQARERRSIAAMPIQRPAPSAPALIPLRLSASGAEALRACPYRYFALQALGLAVREELDDAPDARDHGTWLHEVLQRFHAARPEPVTDPRADIEALHRAADAALAALSRDDADFLPFHTSFGLIAPRYVAWLHAAEAEGWRAQHSELPIETPLPAQDSEPATTLHGRLDRVDVHGSRWRIVDYKTGSTQRLKERVKHPLEDTQLAFYAALLMAERDLAAEDIEAGYLALDDRHELPWIAHPNVGATAQVLADGLSAELARLRAGAPMPALGEGRACEHCDARGLCRRDHWCADDGAAR